MNLHNGVDIIDSRDVIKRLDELQDERNDLEQAVADAKNEQLLESAKEGGGDTATLEILHEEIEVAVSALDDWDADNGEELKALEALDEEGRDATSEWKYGTELVRDSYFERFAQDLAEDTGAVPNTDRWPLTCLDWSRAADELKQDYTTVDFDGIEYWVRRS